MPLPEEELRRFIAESAGVDVSDASIARLTNVCSAACDALQAHAAQSLFDSEPEQLHSILESLADEDSP